MKNAIHAEVTAGFPRLFDLRETSRISARSTKACPLSDLADSRLIVHADADPLYVEQYRRVSAALHHAQLQEGIRSVVIASAVAAEGKTLSATNLALMLSRSFAKRVLLVDGDLRKPSIHELLQLENRVGLSDILEQPATPFPAHTLSPTLSVITGGSHHHDPVSLLVSDATPQFLSEMRERFDWVVVDTPPLVLFPDAELFVSRLDTCVMVVSAVTTPSPVAATAVAAIGAARILGVVLNRTARTEIAAGYGYGPYGYRDNDGARRHAAWWRSRKR